MDELIARVRADQRARWVRGDRAWVEEYLDRHPGLLADHETVLDLIYAEVLLRDELSQPAAADEYCARFPQHAAAIRRQFELHVLLTKGPQATGRAAGPAAVELPAVPGYEIRRELGRGSWGVVYEAVQTNLGRRVAVKVQHLHLGLGPAAGNLRREAALVARLRHPDIVAVYDYGEAGGQAFTVLELVEGGTLAGRANARRYTAAEAARVVELTARAVHHAHLEGVVHRDLKPANILLTPDGRPKVTDFGLARQLGGSSIGAGGAVGTLAYMAPEQAAGRAHEVGPPADIYALGVILHELLTGLPPTGRVDRPLPRGGASRPLEAIRARCLAPDATGRYPSAEALADDLRRYQDGLAPLADRWTARIRRSFPGRKWLVGSVAASLTAGGAIWWRHSQASPPAAVDLATALSRGEAVTLVPDRGPPAWHRWVTPTGTARVAGDEFLVESWACGLVELVPDPGLPSYRLAADVRHDESDESGEVGVYVCRRASGPQADTHCFIQLSFNDVRSGTPVTLGRHVHTAGGRQGLWDLQLSGLTRNLGPPAGRGHPIWRTIAIEVDATTVHGLWSTGQAVGRLSAADLERTAADELAAVLRRAPDHPFADSVRPEHRPRTGLGLYVLRGAAAFRNVRLEPL